MKEKEKIDYICIQSRKAGKNKIKFRKSLEAGICIWWITILKKEQKEHRMFILKRGHRFREKTKKEPESPKLPAWILKRIKKAGKHYQIENSVMDADAEIAEKLQIAEELFQARKQELMMHRNFIFNSLSPTQSGKRRSILFVWESMAWEERDIFTLLLCAKDYYEDIYILYDKKKTEIKRITEEFYEEWGIVVTLLEQGEKTDVSMDFGLFLLADWKSRMASGILIQQAYVVFEREADWMMQKRVRSEMEGKIYSGLVYESAQTELSYRIAVNTAFQNPQIYERLGISVVAIYQLEWYNIG